VTWDDVVAIGVALPAVEVGTAYGTPAMRVKGKFMCRLREDGETLAIRCDPEERPLLLDAHPAVLFLTPHYDNSPMVLVALPRADATLVRELVEDAWAERAPRKLLEAYRAAEGTSQ
jgi:hypothetical protein